MASRIAFTPSFVALWALLAGCSGSGGASDPTTGDGDGTTTTPNSGAIDSGVRDSGASSGGGSTSSGSGGTSGGGTTGGGGSTGGGSTGGGTTGGGTTGGGTTSGGTTGGTTGGGTTGGTTSGGTTGGTTLSKCGAPLDTRAPTTANLASDGPYTVSSYSTGLPSSTTYKSLTVYYPTNAPGPYVVTMISPGLTEILAYLQGWARRFASYGYVAVFVEANNTGNDSAALRADGMWAAITSIKGENTRSGSPLAGKVSSCFVTTGHSLGGGAALTIANAHPNDVKGTVAFNPYDPSTTFSRIVAPTMILAGQSDTTAPPANHGRRQYDTITATVSKEYVEISGGNHQSALSPSTIPGPYAIAWIKYTVDGDARFKPFLAKKATGLSDFATTVP